ncbi:MAG: TonB-dependent receptor [Proteobacteria bacterium]|jgi:iron complex outermembrane receptor protein|nr:TonB-dependent receptor [Pseudomonadota bacterium]MCC6630534.1 TonB-dependent receptor [Gammaproteobacteria bacterium]
MLIHSGRAVRLAVATCIAASATTAFAADEVEALDEIVVTAQFRQQNLQDTPLAITAVTAELMEARSQTNISEITNQAPSVTLKQQSAMFGPAIAAYIRGVGAADFNPALEPGVGIYVDDVYIATLTGSLLDLLDLERVEILRGPQGTLAGRNSIGGAVKLYSQKPGAENTGSFQATYGSRNRVDLRGTANFALGENLFMRISGVDKKQEGYVERRDYGCAFPGNPQGIAPLRASTAGCVVGKDSNVNFSAVRGALRWLPTDNLEVNFSTDYTNDRRNPTGVVLVDYRDATQAAAAIARIQPTLDANPANNIRPSIFVPPRGSYYNYASYYNPVHNGTGEVTNVMVESRANPGQFFEGWGAALDLDWKLSDSLSVKSISAWREYTSGFTNDNDLSPLASSIGDGTLPFHSFSQELRLNGTALDSALNYTVGGYFLDQQSTYQSWQDLRYTGPLQFQQDDVVNVDTKAAFGQIGYKATERAEFTAGIRYTDEHKDYNYVRLNRAGTAPAAGVGSLNGLRSDYDGNNTDYRLAAQYRWNDEVMTYVQWATGFKGGGVSPRPFVVDQAQPFGPEKLSSYEVGVKADLFDRSLRVNADVFTGNYKDLQLGLQTCTGSVLPAPCGRIANAGDARIRGFEFESSYRPVQDFSIDASYSYTDFKYKRLNNVGGIQLAFVAPFMPAHKASIGAQYEFALANGSSVIPRVDGSFQSELYTNGNNQVTNRIGGYTLFNARVTWRNADGDLEAALEGTNLGDKYYFMSRADQYTGAGHTDGAPGRPREFALTIKKRF